MNVRIIDTGRRVFHPRTCGRCHGAGCPIVELAVDVDLRPWETSYEAWVAAQFCQFEHWHDGLSCVPDSIVLGEN